MLLELLLGEGEPRHRQRIAVAEHLVGLLKSLKPERVPFLDRHDNDGNLA